MFQSQTSTLATGEATVTRIRRNIGFSFGNFKVLCDLCHVIVYLYSQYKFKLGLKLTWPNCEFRAFVFEEKSPLVSAISPTLYLSTSCILYIYTLQLIPYICHLGQHKHIYDPGYMIRDIKFMQSWRS